MQYARQDIAFLLSQNVKCIVAACGTVSSTYPSEEAAKLPVPYMGVVSSAARRAARATRNRRIGVIGTSATIRSHSYEQILRRLVPGAEITARACPLFVSLVENGYVDGSASDCQQVTRLVIAPVPAGGAGGRRGHPDPGLHPLPPAGRDDRRIHGPCGDPDRSRPRPPPTTWTSCWRARGCEPAGSGAAPVFTSAYVPDSFIPYRRPVPGGIPGRHRRADLHRPILNRPPGVPGRGLDRAEI